MDAPYVAACELADATLCQACILKLLKNRITARMMGNLVTIQLALMLWFGGSQETNRVGSNLFFLAQINASSGIETEQPDICLLMRLVEAIARCLQPIVQSVHGRSKLPQEPFFKIVIRVKFLCSG